MLVSSSHPHSSPFAPVLSPGHHSRASEHSPAANLSSAPELKSGRGQAASPSAVFIRSERYSQLQQSLSVTQGDVASTQASSAVAEPSEGARQASGTILSFIQAQLQRDVQDGATQEELTSRIEAGLSGFLQGFSQAREQLEQMGFLSESIAAEIQQTHDLVLKGVDELKQAYLGESPAAVVPSNQVFARSDEAESRSFNFSVTTRDGDQVKIGVGSMRASVTQAYAGFGGGVGTLLDYTRSQSSRDQFSLSVEGELDASEMQAITELLGKVNELAQSFFEGDVEQAFASAMDMGFDSNEISGFALKLSHTQVQRATQTYQGIAGLSGASDASASLRPLGGFVQGVIEAMGLANQFSDGEALLLDLTQWFESSSESRFQDHVRLITEGLPTPSDRA